MKVWIHLEVNVYDDINHGQILKFFHSLHPLKYGKHEEI
uniref:Uncharacterized protein n=1 Tax=Anguilla anguilla TaxID=7936 RepID=A0A0E9QWJ0_ANGAN